MTRDAYVEATVTNAPPIVNCNRLPRIIQTSIVDWRIRKRFCTNGIAHGTNNAKRTALKRPPHESDIRICPMPWPGPRTVAAYAVSHRKAFCARIGRMKTTRVNKVLCDLSNVRNLDRAENRCDRTCSSLERCVTVDSASSGRCESSRIVDSSTKTRATKEPPRSTNDIEIGMQTEKMAAI